MVDITEVKDIKSNAIACYKSQFDNPEETAKRILRRNEMEGAKIIGDYGILYLEKLHTNLPLIINNNQFKYFFFQ